MSLVHDPLRFGADETEADVIEDVPLDDDPPAPVQPESSPSRPSSAADPLLHPTPDVSSREPTEQPARFTGLPAPSGAPFAPSLSASEPLSAFGAAPSTAPTAKPSGNMLNGSMLQDVEIHQGAPHDAVKDEDDGHMRQNAAAEAAGPSHRSTPQLHIGVSDPVKRYTDHSFLPGVSSSHYEYLITSGAARDGSPAGAAPAQRTQVRRRFKDFVALADLLEETYRGYFIFPRPDKGALEGAASGRSEGEFVEARRTELERYLRRLARHPVLGTSEALQTFLQAEGSLSTSFPWQQLQPLKGSLMEGVARLPRQLLGSDSSVPTTTDAAKNARHTNDLLRRLREMGERMRQEYQPPSSLPDDEIRLREAKAGVELFSETVAHASRRAERLLREFERVGAATGDLGLAFIRLAKYEDEHGGQCGPYSEFSSAAKTIATDSRRVGMAAVRMSRLARSTTAESVGALEPLHLELALAPAVTAALREREAALLTVDSIQEDLDRKRASLAGVEEGQGGTGDANKARKAATLRNEIASLEAAVEAAQAEYDRVKGRNLEELARWGEEKEAEFARMMRGYAQVAALYEERAAQVWRGVEEDLKGEGDSGSL